MIYYTAEYLSLFGTFKKAIDDSFRKSFKRDYYAWLYGSYQAECTKIDFHSMYLMGGEL